MTPHSPPPQQPGRLQDGVVEGDFLMLSPKELMTKDIDELRQLVQERREKAVERQQAGGAARARDRKRDRGGGSKDDKQQQQQRDKEGSGKGGGAVSGNGPTAMDEDGGVSSVEVVSVVTLSGHDGEVFTCAFSPTDPLVASGCVWGPPGFGERRAAGRLRSKQRSPLSHQPNLSSTPQMHHHRRSGDATARIWDLSASPPSTSARVLDHPPADDSKQGKDVTTLEWNPDGTMLATGAYDGRARIWSKEGERGGASEGFRRRWQ